MAIIVEKESTGVPQENVIEVVRFSRSLTTPTQTIASIQTAASSILILPQKTYRLTAGGAADLRFRLSSDGVTATAAGATDILLAAGTSIIFKSQHFNTIHADGTTGSIVQIEPSL